jgi:uncharacterized protein (DUF2384 family)
MHSLLKTIPNNALLTLKEISGYTGIPKSTYEARLRTGKLSKQEIRLAWRKIKPCSTLYWTAEYVRNNIELFS